MCIQILQWLHLFSHGSNITPTYIRKSAGMTPSEPEEEGEEKIPNGSAINGKVPSSSSYSHKDEVAGKSDDFPTAVLVFLGLLPEENPVQLGTGKKK